jgi:hypothetical protein
MLEIEKRLVESDFIIADENYISDGWVLVNKEFLRSKVLLNCKTKDENIMSHIPYEMGEYINLTGCGTKCELCSSERIGIIADENNSVDYNHVKLFLKSFPFSFIEFTKQDYMGGLLIKAFDEEEKFVGCFCSMLKNDKRGDLC